MEAKQHPKLVPGLSRWGVWAFAVGTSVGWGSLVVTSNTYLSQAGPWGSVLGLILGAAMMLLISRNYSYLMQIYPDAGGAYTYASRTFGHDYGFLTGWFLTLVYLAMLWANATSLPLFARNFIGGFFEFGKLYTLFGYDVYLGEILLTAGAILLFTFICTRKSRLSITLMIILSGLFTAGITLAFAAAVFGLQISIAPGFAPDSDALSQIIRIAVVSPWAFIGFESISHGSEEMSFHRGKVFRTLVAAIVTITLLYVFVTLLSVTAYPERYGSWMEYIRDRGNLEGLEAFPAFYAAKHYLGDAGTVILMLSLLALVFTSLIGNISATSRLFYAQAKDRVLPETFAKLNRHGVPANAMKLIAAVSLVAAFAGRTAIGWIVDVTVICAVLIYSFVSAAAAKTARLRRDRTEQVTGYTGVAVMILVGLSVVLPSLVSTGSLETETYLLFIVWSILGFLFFRFILEKDKEKRFGTSAVVWVVLLALVLFISLVWMRQNMIASNDRMMDNIHQYYASVSDGLRRADEQYIEDQVDQLEKANIRTVAMSIGMFAFALAVMLTNHRAMNRRTRESEAMANIDPMTGVKSKHAFMVREKELNADLAAGRNEAFAVAVCDVNGLKRINDTLGHKAGDEYICEASRMICDIFDHSPVYRIGGDEFVVVMTGRDYERRNELMQALHDRSVEHIDAGGVVVSGGLSDWQGDESFHDVFERADSRMYSEKELLKGLGAVSRDETAGKTPEPEEASILSVRKRLLIAEDVAINRDLLGAILEEDYDLLFAGDGMEALEMIEENRDQLSLLLLDLQMPRMDGRELLQVLKSDPAYRRLPVIVLTGDQLAEVECLRLGAIDFIPKPYPGPEIVKARVEKSIELSETREIIQSTERDPLTKLYNTDYFIRYVEAYDAHYESLPMDALLFDVSRFQILCERYGRKYGDTVLQLTGEQIRHAARRLGGVGCRQGTDTFLLYCPHQEDYDQLLETVNGGIAAAEGKEKIRLRMGVYANVDKSLEIDRRFDRARQAADSVRGSRVRSIGFYDEKVQEAQMYRDRLLEDFRSSLEENRFKVYFQPKFDIRPDHPVLASAEALVRWEHPELGLIPPGNFIPLLEDSGLILDLDIYVWKTTARNIRAWKDRFGASIPVSVNVSRIDMLAPEITGILGGILSENRLSPEDMILEITESAYTGDAERVIAVARELRGDRLGFRIEMDDFGTGYSSLGMLTQLPIDALKLDMSFVRSAFSGKRDVRLIRLILDIAENLHVPVVAEGVETEEQLTVLKEMGCDLAQGYYFSKPLPEDAFETFIRKQGGTEAAE